jgi:hypothetical protein
MATRAGGAIYFIPSQVLQPGFERPGAFARKLIADVSLAPAKSQTDITGLRRRRWPTAAPKAGTRISRPASGLRATSAEVWGPPRRPRRLERYAHALVAGRHGAVP